MIKINLGKIIKAKKLDEHEVAKQLFPLHKYPKMALDRVNKGEGVLDANQISKFSLYSGIPIAELYSGSEWKSSIDKTTHILTSGDFTAKLDTTNWTTKLFHKDSLFHTFVIHSSSITLEEYIEKLKSEINKTNNK